MTAFDHAISESGPWSETVARPTRNPVQTQPDDEEDDDPLEDWGDPDEDDWAIAE